MITPCKTTQTELNGPLTHTYELSVVIKKAYLICYVVIVIKKTRRDVFRMGLSIDYVIVLILRMLELR